MKNVLVVLASIACVVPVYLAACFIATLGLGAIFCLTVTVLPNVTGVIVGCVIMLALSILTGIIALKIEVHE